jgi:hypothetical protein
MNGIDLSDQLPESYLEKAVKVGVRERELRGSPRPIHEKREDIRAEVKRVVRFIKETIFPKVKG